MITALVARVAVKYRGNDPTMYIVETTVENIGELIDAAKNLCKSPLTRF